MRYSPFRHVGSLLLKKEPVQLTLFLTRRCNARCPFCFYSANGGGQSQTRELSSAELEQVSASMGPLLWLALSGGEIFLREDLVEITKIWYERNRPAIILLPTNGLLPSVIRDRTEEILKLCSKSTIAVKLSLDGVGALHDRLRGVDGAFGKTMDTFALLSGLMDRYPHLELGFNTVFCAENEDWMDEIIDFVTGLDRRVTHTVSLVRGNVPDPAQKHVDLEQYRRAALRLEKLFREKRAGRYRFPGARIKAAQDILQRKLIYETAVTRRALTPCFAGRLNLVLTETGELYPCEAFTRSLGNVRDAAYDIGAIVRSKRGREMIESIRNERCFRTHECYMMTNILFNPRRYPALMREYARIGNDANGI